MEMKPEEPPEKKEEEISLIENETTSQNNETIDFTPQFPGLVQKIKETLNYESWGFHNY